MRLLPILWTEPPTPEDWVRLSAARKAIGYHDKVQPVKALQGSPGTLLVVGTASPDWLHNFYRVTDTANEAELQWALDGALRSEERSESFQELLSGWMGCDVKLTGEEEYAPNDRFI